MTSNNSDSQRSPFPRRLLWHILIGISLYWFSNALVVFPWIFSKTLGIIAMFLSIVLWGFMAFYCLKHVPRSEWNRDTLSMALSFLFTGVVQDYFLYAVYRGVPDELYEPTTFVAYGLVFLLPFLVRHVLMKNYDLRNVLLVTTAKLLITVFVGVVGFLFTLWSIRYW